MVWNQNEKVKMNFEFFEKVSTAANSDQISENPDRGVNLFRFFGNCFKFGQDRGGGRLSRYEFRWVDEWVKILYRLLCIDFTGVIIQFFTKICRPPNSAALGYSPFSPYVNPGLPKTKWEKFISYWTINCCLQYFSESTSNCTWDTVASLD